jgi:glycosyltransferase involved in cell wall biosynthesis
MSTIPTPGGTEARPDEIAIAVIIPAYRQPGLLAEAIRSVLAQEGGPPAAAVVVDDGCPDPDTSRTARAMAAARPGRVFALRRPNGGLSAARNTGIDFALAAFPALRALFCLDADNRLHPHFLSRAFAALEAAPSEVGWLYPDIDEIGRPQNFTTGGDFSLLMLLAENYCDAGSLMRRELVDRGLRFDERMRAGFEDWDFWLQAAGMGYVGRHLPRAGFLYRRRPESMLSEAERRRTSMPSTRRCCARSACWSSKPPRRRATRCSRRSGPGCASCSIRRGNRRRSSTRRPRASGCWRRWSRWRPSISRRCWSSPPTPR